MEYSRAKPVEKVGLKLAGLLADVVLFLTAESMVTVL